jgi:hypothetical protein
MARKETPIKGFNFVGNVALLAHGELVAIVVHAK